ncbi:IQ motif, EF-hand binding site-containing protein [Cynara cardunculus var. scolymus]|uniref:IQ motif, EF-hand binding site-containing protein n=1 Tax=Cynara cardunculus var. scolymus TaxID=59895 RepID=A0A103XYC0_CYNCS|nr:IQ motif, EF-hand binding site-containing protein [Cynara cardunculus var. scolymus]
MLVSPLSVTRSSLEEMLDSLRRRDEAENQKDLPPALPSRPTSKARLPKRLLPAKFDMEYVAPPDTTTSKKQDVKCISEGGSNFGRKKVKEAAAGGESPYTMTPVIEQRLAENGGASLATPSTSPEAEWDDSIGYFVKKKLRVWCRPRNDQWELAKIKSTVGEAATVMLLDGSAVKVSTGDLLPANTEILDGVDDLIELGYLNEPSVLHNLQYRYARDVIYSKAGPVLLAINPFKDVQIFGSDFITAYREKILDNPHVSILTFGNYHKSQWCMLYLIFYLHPLLYSGESGSGKTETAKIAMQYLASVGGENCEMACKVIQSSCILEAFGNAKTSRNCNSSRFVGSIPSEFCAVQGKLIDIRYSAEGTICGACIQTISNFDIVQARVSQICRGERSYHIFYQICAGAPSALKDRLNLKMASEYKLLNQSGCLKINGADDSHNFKMLMEAFDILGIPREDQENVFELLAAILWLGNISFEAIDKRDALAQFVYESLFSWLVGEINRSLEGGKQHTERTISIIDMYGFESLQLAVSSHMTGSFLYFQKNSFQQFFINYADERLQQHFIRHLCKLEQEEYELDGIHWKKVDFEDNQECLDLFEKGSKSSTATDVTFTNKIKRHLSSNLRFSCERGVFRVRHYAGEVQYDATGFLERSSDTLHFNTIQLLSSSRKKLLNIFASGVMNPSQTTGLAASDSHEQSVGAKFKDQLFKLIHKLENSKPHFIRCIRPNTKQLPGMYEKDIVLEQLRCSGVMEIVQISKSRFPIRLTHQEFATRFGCLLSENIICMDPLSTSVAILQQCRVSPQTYQVGYTKLFFRVGQVEVLENLRQRVLEGTCEVENIVLGGRVLLDFHELKFAIVTFQSFVRGENARREYERWKKSALDSSRSRRKSRCRNSESKDLSEENIQFLPQNVEELQRRVVKAESSLSEREQENTALREQIRQFEIRWLEYETKMKAMSLAEAKKTLGADISYEQLGRRDRSPSPHCYDSEDNVSGTQTPVQIAPLRIGNNRREINGVVSDTLDNLNKEFEQKKQIFDEDAKAVTDVKPGRPPSTKQIEEYRTLKRKFETWKKEYKHRLREAKSRLVKGINAEYGGDFDGRSNSGVGGSIGTGGDRRARNWWGKLSKRGKERPPV